MTQARRSQRITAALLPTVAVTSVVLVAALFQFIRSETAPLNNFPGLIDPAGRTVEERFRVPNGFVRVAVANDSFAAYLRRLPLKPHLAPVLLYNGLAKENQGVHAAVIDLKIGNKDLQQCADAVIRLRAEYLYRQRRFDHIHFNLTNGFRVDYAEWRKGRRVIVHGDRTYWAPRRGPAESAADFWDYLEFIFSYAGTRSLARELEPVRAADMQIGDVFIQGGSPGHAVIVVDQAVDPQKGGKLFLLAQSYMPAQEIHILRNPDDPESSPWYAAGIGDFLTTPEWVFQRSDLKRFAAQ